jgi:hypothetical protein
MTKNKIAKSLIRDYAHEHQLRAEKKKRFVCDIEKEQAQNFEAMLKAENITFSKWIKDQINDYMKEAK